MFVFCSDVTVDTLIGNVAARAQGSDSSEGITYALSAASIVATDKFNQPVTTSHDGYDYRVGTINSWNSFTRVPHCFYSEILRLN